MKLNNLDAATVLIFEGGLVVFLMGLLSQSSLMSQVGEALGRSNSQVNDFLIFGTLFMGIGALITIVPEESSGTSGSSFYGRDLNLPTGICAALLLASFFLPWTQVLGVSVSGLDIGRIGSAATLALAIPLSAAVLCVNNAFGIGSRAVGSVVGALPVAALMVLAVKSDVNIFKVLGFGAYVMCIAGVALILIVNGVISVPTKRLVRTDIGIGR